ncbi:hypothetical protein KO498_17115 [Lentibacter algarum]|uniref:hypothetical protein n=1 Tax=Lentibacter algarum TaxID=576131 RepID=UPI001C081B56|nr:hypothetical protein [Lentibacter algarum]MBU2983530.1 hypothetical protein [Lentibacter algarum]
MQDSGFPVIHAQRAVVEPSEHFVFGERNTGTNLVHSLLIKNIPALARSAGDRIGAHGFRYGWKHGFPMMVAAPASTLAVVLFRGPEPWLRSMHKRPWHAPERAAMPFAEFIRAEWVSRIDEQNFGVLRDDARWGAELQYDRHPLTGAGFDNILALRNAKTTGFLSLAARFESCLLVRHEDVSADPEGFVECVSQLSGLPRYEQFRPVEARRGRATEGKFTPAEYAPLEEADHAFVWQRLEVSQEARLGYFEHPQEAGDA